VWDLQSDRPIYSQLVEQIQLMVVSGIYPAGSRLPSVRDLAAEASVNPNTMQRALAQLENDGLLFTQRTSGRFVTEDVGKIMQVKNNLAVDVIREFIDKMNHLGYDGRQTVSLVGDYIKEGGKSGERS
jgi:DNA-binding transcriptional regulator YhcF (GntR family)